MTIRVMGPTLIRPDALWPGHDMDAEERWFCPEWFDPETEEHRPPPAHLELFIPAGDGDPMLAVGYDGYDSHPLAEAGGERVARTLRWQIPRLVLSEAVFEAVVELIPLAEQVVAGFSIARGGPRGWRQELTPAAMMACEEIERALPGLLEDLPVLHVHAVTEIDPAVLASLITDATGDEELRGVVEQLTARITAPRPQDRVMLDDGLAQVTRLRNEARIRVRDRLRIVAGLASEDRRERDELLRRITSWGDGDSYRSLGAAVGLSHTTVRKIVTREGTDPDEAVAPGELPATAMPVPAAVMQARHVTAAVLHLSAARHLAANNGADCKGSAWEVSGEETPLDAAFRRATEPLRELRGYAERCAVASGAITETPKPLATDDPADRALYPGTHLWCATAGHTLPQPGQDPEATATGNRDKVRHLLTGPVPATRLSEYATGRHVVKARDVVTGTPAEPIWQAYRDLYAYSSDWMCTAADAPGDLAAALEGCREVLETVGGIVSGVLDEITRRAERGTLVGVDTGDIAAARKKFSTESGVAALWLARNALDGATPVLPTALGTQISPEVALEMTGRTAAQIREALGDEVFTNRHIEKVRAADHTRAESLEHIAAFMHASTATAVYGETP